MPDELLPAHDSRPEDDQGEAFALRINKIHASLKVDFMKEALKSQLAQHTDAAKWLTASLLAINLAGSAAVFQAQIEPNYKTLPVVLFTCGVLSSLLSSFCGQQSNSTGLLMNIDLALFWENAKFEGIINQNLLEDIAKQHKSPMRWAYASRGAGWVSVLFYVSGLVALGRASGLMI